MKNIKSLELKSNLKDWNVLSDLVNQAVVQLGLENIEGSLVIGTKEGGLAYRLFSPLYSDQSSKQLDKISFKEIGMIKDYLDTIQEYITNAKKHAEKYGFGLVNRIEKRDWTYISEPTLKGSLDIKCIGSSTIESVERIYDFFDMIISGKDGLEEQRKKLISQSENLKRKSQHYEQEGLGGGKNE